MKDQLIRYNLVLEKIVSLVQNTLDASMQNLLKQEYPTTYPTNIVHNSSSKITVSLNSQVFIIQSLQYIIAEIFISLSYKMDKNHN